MRSGMSASVTFLVAMKKSVLVIPSEALNSKDDHLIVLLPGGGRNARPVEREIEVGMSDGKNVEVVSGLAENDMILAPQYNHGREESESSDRSSPTERMPAGH